LGTVIVFIILVNYKVKAFPIGPDKYFIDLSVGKEKQESLFLYGRDDLNAPVTVFLYPAEMQKLGEDNDRKFSIPSSNDKASIANWIRLNKTEVTIKPGETIEVKWTIAPSGLAKCGTNLGAIIVSDKAPDSNNSIQSVEVSITSQVVSQIHLNIIADEKGNCINNGTTLRLVQFNLVKSWPIFTMDEAVKFETKLENYGDYMAIDPEGYISLVGINQKNNLPFNQEQLDIYPNTIRRFETIYTTNFPVEGNFFQKLLYEIRNFKIGKYEAKLGVSKNVQPAIQASVTYWVFPWRTILLALVILWIFSIIIIWKNKRKRY